MKNRAFTVMLALFMVFCASRNLRCEEAPTPDALEKKVSKVTRNNISDDNAVLQKVREDGSLETFLCGQVEARGEGDNKYVIFKCFQVI